jgi:hypothetical protein
MPTSPTSPSKKTSTITAAAITTTSNAYNVPLHYVDMDNVQTQNNRIKDIATDYSLTTQAIDTMCDLTEQIKDMMRRANGIANALTHNEAIIAQLLQGTGERARVIEHFDDIHHVLRIVRMSTTAQHAQSIQNSLARSLDKFRSLHTDAVDLHIQEIQDSFANTDPYPPPIPQAKRSPKPQEIIKELSKEIDDVEEKEKEVAKPHEVEAMDEDDDIPPLPIITPSILSHSPQGSVTPTMAEEVDHLEAFLNMYYTTPTKVVRFHPPQGYRSLKKGGEKDTRYWHNILDVFMDIADVTSTTRKGISIAMLQGGPPHAPFFICEYQSGGYVVGPSKKRLACYAIGDETL